MSSSNDPKEILEVLKQRARNQINTLHNFQPNLDNSGIGLSQTSYSPIDASKISNTLTSIQTTVPIIEQTLNNLINDRDGYLKQNIVPTGTTPSSHSQPRVQNFSSSGRVTLDQTEIIEEKDFKQVANTLQSRITELLKRFEIFLEMRVDDEKTDMPSTDSAFTESMGDPWTIDPQALLDPMGRMQGGAGGSGGGYGYPLPDLGGSGLEQIRESEDLERPETDSMDQRAMDDFLDIPDDEEE